LPRGSSRNSFQKRFARASDHCAVDHLLSRFGPRFTFSVPRPVLVACMHVSGQVIEVGREDSTIIPVKTSNEGDRYSRKKSLNTPLKAWAFTPGLGPIGCRASSNLLRMLSEILSNMSSSFNTIAEKNCIFNWTLWPAR
jgi:hypothetical protein